MFNIKMIFVMKAVIFNMAFISFAFAQVSNECQKDERKPSAPKFTEEPASMYVSRTDEQVHLQCRATGYPFPTIYWLKNKLNMTSFRSIVIKSGCQDGVTFNVLSLMTIWDFKDEEDHDNENVGDYQCVASNSYGTITSRVAKVYEKYIGIFTKPPYDVATHEGKTAYITCDPPKGVPKPSIKWLYQSSEAEKEVPVEYNARKQNRDGNLQINNVVDEDGGFYTCVASNIAGTRRSSAAMLTIQKLPHFVKKPKNLILRPGELASFKCEATGDFIPWISFLKDSVPISNKDKYIVKANEVIVKKVKYSDTGSYTCKAKNLVGEVLYTVYLKVTGEPEISYISQSFNYHAGVNIILTCDVTNLMTSSFRWSGIQNKVLQQNRNPFKSRAHLIKNNQLMILDGTKTDSGIYICTNDENFEGKRINLTVSGYKDKIPPVILLAPSNQSALISDAISFTCKVQSRANDVKIQWIKDDLIMDIVPKWEENTISEKRISVSRTRLNEGIVESLRIFDSKLSDQAKYTCKVIDSNGVTSASAYLSVLPIGENIAGQPNTPGKPGLIRLMSSTTDSLTVQWTAPHFNDQDNLSYQLSYFQVGHSQHEWTTLQKVKETKLTVTDLQPSARVYFVVSAINHYGSSEVVTSETPFFTQDYTNRFENYHQSELDDILLDKLQLSIVDDFIPLQFELTWNTNKDLCNFALGYEITIAMNNSKLTSQLSTTPCNQRVYRQILPKSIYNLAVRIRPYTHQSTNPTGLLAMVSMSGKVVIAQPIVATSTRILTGRTGLEVIWKHPQVHEIITSYMLICESTDYYEVVYAETDQIKATCQQVPRKLVHINITLSYMTIIGKGPKIESKIQLGPRSSNDHSLTNEDHETNNSEEIGASPEVVNDANKFLSTPTGIAVLAIGAILIICFLIGVVYYITKRRNPKLRDRAARPMDHYSQPYGQNFDLTVMDRTSAGLGDVGYAKMTERRTSSGGGNIYISPGIGLPPHSFAGGKLPMTSYQAGRCSATNESQPAGGFSYVNDQLISPNSIPLHFTTDQQKNGINSISQQEVIFSQARHQDVARHLPTIIKEVPPSPPLSQKTRASELSMSSGSVMQSNHSTSSGQHRRRSLRNNVVSSRLNLVHSNYSSPTFNSPSPVPVSRVDTNGYHNDQPYANYPHISRNPTVCHNDPRQSMAVSGISMVNACGSNHGCVSPHEVEDEQEDDYRSSSGEESFDMPSASQVGTNIDYQHINQNVPIRQQFPNHHEYLPTLEEVGHGRKDTDPLLMKCTQSSDVSRHLRQNGATGSINGTRADNISRGSSMTSSYHHHTGDSGMSAGVGSTEQSSLRSEAGPQLQPQQHYVQIENRRPTFIDDKFVGTLSPPPSAVSMQSGYNSTASSCWQYQPTNPKIPSASFKQKSWRHLHETCAKKSLEEERNTSEEIKEFSDQIEITIANRTHTEPNYQNIHYEKNAKSSNSLKKANTVPVNGFSLGEVSTSDFYSDQSQ